jgi:hypothetical protein
MGHAQIPRSPGCVVILARDCSGPAAPAGPGQSPTACGPVRLGPPRTRTGTAGRLVVRSGCPVCRWPRRRARSICASEVPMPGPRPAGRQDTIVVMGHGARRESRAGVSGVLELAVPPGHRAPCCRPLTPDFRDRLGQADRSTRMVTLQRLSGALPGVVSTFRPPMLPLMLPLCCPVRSWSSGSQCCCCPATPALP